MRSLTLHETFRIIEPYLKEHGFRYTDANYTGTICAVTCDTWDRKKEKPVGLTTNGAIIKVAISSLRHAYHFDLHKPDTLCKLVQFLKNYYTGDAGRGNIRHLLFKPKVIE